jgi:F0F1-type ATP synthase gamma subunit
LCGGFNNNVVKEIKKTIEENPENEYSILTIGKKSF